MALEFPYDEIMVEAKERFGINDAVKELAYTIGMDLARYPNKDFSEVLAAIKDQRGMVWPREAEKIAVFTILADVLGGFEHALAGMAEEQLIAETQ